MFILSKDGEEVKRQIRISDTHYKELCELADDLGLKNSELLGAAISILRALRKNKATGLKVVSGDRELEMLLSVDMSK